MSMIEGIGDEVIHFFAIVIILLLAVIAWWSTNISEGPIIRTVLILERRSHSRTSNESNPQPSVTFDENSIDTGQGDTDIVEAETRESGEDKEENESSSSLLLPANQSVQPTAPELDPPAISEIVSNEEPTMTSTEPVNPPTQQQPVELEMDESHSSVLRKRRLAFFQNRGPTLIEPTTGSDATSQNPPCNETNCDCNPESSSQNDNNPDQIRIRLKYLNDDQIVVEGRLQEQLGEFKRRHFRIELAAEKMVRLIFNGQVLQSDNQTLQAYGLFDNCVVHCLVHNQRNSTPRTAQTQTSGTSQATTPPDWNLSTLLYTCLSVILGFAWYCRYQYSHLFTVTTTAALSGLTGMFAVTLLSVYLPEHDNIV